MDVFYAILVPRCTSRGFLPVIISHYDSPLMCQVTWQSPHSSPTISMFMTLLHDVYFWIRGNCWWHRLNYFWYPLISKRKTDGMHQRDFACCLRGVETGGRVGDTARKEPLQILWSPMFATNYFRPENLTFARAHVTNVWIRPLAQTNSRLGVEWKNKTSASCTQSILLCLKYQQ